MKIGLDWIEPRIHWIRIHWMSDKGGDVSRLIEAKFDGGGSNL